MPLEDQLALRKIKNKEFFLGPKLRSGRNNIKCHCYFFMTFNKMPGHLQTRTIEYKELPPWISIMNISYC